MKTPLLGLCAVVLLLFGAVAGVLTGFATTFALLNLSLGAALILVWFVIYGSAHTGELLGGVSRWSKGERESLLYLILITVCVVALNWIAARPQFNFRIDFTSGGFESLSPQTIELLHALDRPLEMKGFFHSAAEMRGGADQRKLLELYQSLSPQISLSFVDPGLSPQVVEQYGMRPGEKLYIGYLASNGIKIERRLARLAEDAITAALTEILKSSAYKIYYTIGHAEPELTSDSADGLKLFADTLAKERFIVAPYFIGEQGRIPADTAMLIILSPTKPFLSAEKSAVLRYIESGGRVLMLEDPRYPVTNTAVRDLSKALGIAIGEDVIIDLKQRLSADTEPVVRMYGKHLITGRFSNQDVTVFTFASSVVKAEDFQAEAAYTPLLMTSAASWAERDLGAIFGQTEPIVNIEKNELRGPLPLALAYERRFADKMARVVVMGDSDWLQNSRLKLFSNRDLLLNTVSWIAGDESAISIRPKMRKFSEFPLPQESFKLVATFAFVLPELILLLGLVLWWRREVRSYEVDGI